MNSEKAGESNITRQRTRVYTYVKDHAYGKSTLKVAAYSRLLRDLPQPLFPNINLLLKPRGILIHHP